MASKSICNVDKSLESILPQYIVLNARERIKADQVPIENFVVDKDEKSNETQFVSYSMKQSPKPIPKFPIEMTWNPNTLCFVLDKDSVTCRVCTKPLHWTIVRVSSYFRNLNSKKLAAFLDCCKLPGAKLEIGKSVPDVPPQSCILQFNWLSKMKPMYFTGGDSESFVLNNYGSWSSCNFLSLVKRIWNSSNRSMYFNYCGLWGDKARLGASWCCYPRTRIWLPSGLRAEILVKATPREVAPIRCAIAYMQIAAGHMRDNITGYFSIPIQAIFLKYYGPSPSPEGE